MINLHINSSKQKEIGDALMAFLKDANLDVQQHDAGDHVVYIASDGPSPETAPAVIHSPDAVLPPIAAADIPVNVPGTVVPVEIAMGTIGGPENELTVALSPQDVVAAATEPEPVEKAEEHSGGELVLKNLSTVCTIPFCVNTSMPHSELKVQKLSPAGSEVSFSYCSMSFKFPVEKAEAQSVICNTNPQFTDTSIRAIACIDGKDIPVLLKLVEGDECCVVFGQDVASALTQSSEKNNHGPVSTQ